MADKCIGTLTIKTNKLKQQIDEVNKLLGKLGVGADIDISKALTGSIEKALKALVNEAKNAGAATQQAFAKVQSGPIGGFESKLTEISSMTQHVARDMDALGNVVSRVTDTVIKGFDEDGNKITEFANGIGEVTKRTEELGSGVSRAIKLFEQLQAKEAQRDVLQIQGRVDTAQYAKLAEEINRITNEFFKFDEAQRRVAVSSEKGVAAERARMEIVQAASRQEEASINRAVRVAENADARRTASAEAAAQRRAEAEERAAQREAAQRERLTIMYRQMFDEIEAREARTQESRNAAALEREFQSLNDLIELYRQYFDYRTRAFNAEASGNQPSADMYTGLSHDALAQIQEYSQEMRNLAEASNEVRTAQIACQNAINTNAMRDQATATREAEARNREYAAALVNLYNEQTRLNNAIASGRIREGSEEYQAATVKIQHLNEAVAEVGTRTNAEGIRMASSMQNVRRAMDELVQSQARLRDTDIAGPLTRAEGAYRNLTTAIKNYGVARKANDTERMNIWQDEINAQMAIINGIREEVSALGDDVDLRERILNFINQSDTAYSGFVASQNAVVDASREWGNQISGLVTRYFSLIAIIRTISELIKNTTEYVGEYYDKMNEIRIITGKTEEEADRLGKTYRDLASEMSVSSLDMADAAIYFTRQGLLAEDINKRLKYTTQYAKTANIEFERAAELITAVVNSMDLVSQEAEDGRDAAQRVADVFLEVGDNAATSGEEIGTAMQKAAAAAGAFGMDFEWLAAYIATVSETTRQEATSIGTAFNTLIARLHSIRTTGYNSEDETKINDIQKALKNINVTLMDQEGNWRQMTDIFNDVAAVWDTLDGKTKSYIATTMAGVKQQNVFLALMEDLSQEAEGTSRAWELYEKAINSAGTAQEKYAVYTESVAAAQERLKVAQEEFYSLLNANVIKDWYGWLANIVTTLNNGTEALNGWNIYLPLIAGGIAMVVVAARNLSSVVTILEAHPVILTIAGVTAGIVALIGAISWLGDVIDTESEKYERASKRLDDSIEKIRSYNSLQVDAGKMFDELEIGTISAKDGLDAYNSTLDRLAKISPEAKKAVEDLKSGFGDQTSAIETLNQEMEKAIDLQARLAMISLRDKYLHWGASEDSISMSGYMSSFDGNRATGILDQDMFASSEAFAEKLKSTWGRVGGQTYFNEAERNFINEQMKDLRDVAYDERWEYIGQKFWEKFFGGGDIRPVTEVMKDQINNMITDAVSSGGINFDSVELGVFRQRLMGAILGGNGELEYSEYQNAGKAISNMINGILADGFELTDTERLDYIGTEIFGESFKKIVGNIEDLVSDNPELAETISEAYQELLKAGFDNEDIKFILEDMPVSQWGDMVQQMKSQIKSGWEDIYGAFGLDLSELFGADWEDVDFETLRIMPDLYEMDAEAIKDVISAAQNSQSLQEFIEKMRELKIVTESTDDKTPTIEDYAKQIKAFASEIKSIDTILANIENGKGVNFNDIFELSTSHPEILAAAGSITELREALVKLREEVQESTRASIKESVLGNAEFFASTDYYASLNEAQQEEILTLQDYLDSLGEESEEYAKVNEWIDSLIEKMVGLNEETEKTNEETTDVTKTIKAATQEISKIDSLLKSLKKDGSIGFDDLLNLASAHPEIMGTITDINSLIAALNELRRNDATKTIASLREMMTTSEDALKSSKFAGATWTDESGTEHVAKTMKDILDNAKYFGQEMIDELNGYLDNAMVTFLASSDQLGSVSKEVLGQWMENLFPESNVDLLKRKAVDMGDSIATVLTETITASADGREGIKWNQDIICNFTPITPDGELLDDDTFYSYIDDLFAKSSNLEELLENDKNGKGLLISANIDFESFEQGMENAEAMAELLHKLQEAYYGVADANKTWLETQMEQAEKNEENEWAKSNGYIQQLSEIQRQLSEFGGEQAVTYFNNLDDKMKEGIASTYPGVIKALGEMEKATSKDEKSTKELAKATEDLNKALKSSKDYANTKYFTDTAKAIKSLEDGTISATDAYNVYNKECDKVTKAQEDIADVMTKLDKEVQPTVSDVSNLAGVLGMSAEEILSDFPSAVGVFNELIGAGGDLEAMFNRLNEAAFIKITGVSEADFSNLENGLFAVRSDAEDVINLLTATGQWEVTSVSLPQTANVWDPFKNAWIKKSAAGSATVLKPTGNNPFKGKSKPISDGSSGGKGGRGGGGGGSKKDESDSSSSKNQMTEVEKMLDTMSQVDAIQKSQQNFYQAQQKYYSQTKQIQGVIGAMEREKEVLEAQNPVLESNIARIEQYIKQKSEELDALSTSDERYEEVADDLDKLQKAHQNYSKQLIENKTAIDALNESMKEQQKKIRQMEIDLRNTILKAIQDREARTKSMLDAEIKMENIIFGLIKQRYERERDEIVNTTNMKIDALNREKSLLSEQLQLRKEQAEAEDKLLKLNQLEEQYQRIMADPTRRKEAQTMKKQIDDLRKEMAWDTAENEVKAQQDAIDQQITSLDDYIEYIENYYEELFEYPDKLIQEMREIMTMTDTEIIEWLMKNDREYAAASQNAQKQMVDGWTDALNDMHGIMQTYWEEVEFIISQGDEYIINFLKENSQDYAEAGKLQAEAYVEEWQEQLDNLRRAHEQVAIEIAENYRTIAQSEASAKSNSSSSSGSGGRGGNNNNNNNNATSPFMSAAYNIAGSVAAGAAGSVISGTSSVLVPTGTTGLSGTQKTNYNTLKKYATGGTADYSGLAWLDGSPQNPERVLSPYQTKLFETMIEALERASRIQVPTMPDFDGGPNMTPSNSVSIGDIIVNVENLDTDEDYEEMAERVGEVIMERIGRNSVIGGLRVRSY